ncbi:response regulator [Zhaonella formicivorans]|uniref:response regulator n=1 Tax=Zhaonella formicivorans TaxID=2528593 RepID=UPI0010DED9A0|nr:response regulator [Zhaonella formicivorans]
MPIKVMIVDDIKETRDNVRRLLALDEEIVVVGEAENGEEALNKVDKIKPHIILMDINMPVLDGLSATEQISTQYPDVSVIMMTVQGEFEYIKRAMTAGARDYICKPFSSEDLLNSVKKIYQLEYRKKNVSDEHHGTKSQPQTVVVFGTKGGVGKTTVATNLAVSLHQVSGKKVVLLDLDLQFGDVSAMLNIFPKQTLAQLVQENELIDADLVQSYVLPHPATGLSVLSAPARPQYADLIDNRHVEQIIKALQKTYEYVVIDTPAAFDENVLSALDLASQIHLVLTMDLPAIKNAKLCLEVLEGLGLKEKVRIILNNSCSDYGLRAEDVERTLGLPILCQLPPSDKVVITAVNRGTPFVVTNPTAKISENIEQLARMVVKKAKTAAAQNKKPGLLASMFSL